MTLDSIRNSCDVSSSQCNEKAGPQLKYDYGSGGAGQLLQLQASKTLSQPVQAQPVEDSETTLKTGPVHHDASFIIDHSQLLRFKVCRRKDYEEVVLDLLCLALCFELPPGILKWRIQNIANCNINFN